MLLIIIQSFELLNLLCVCRFESSSHAISMSAYLREQRRELYSKSGELQGEEGDELQNKIPVIEIKM